MGSTKRRNQKSKTHWFLKINGVSETNGLVVGNVFSFYSSVTGLPLDVILQEIKVNNFVIDWVEFYKDAIKAGWTSKRILQRIEDSIIDVYGREYFDHINLRLSMWT